MHNREKEGIIVSNASELFLGPITQYEPVYSNEIADAVVIKNGLVEAIGESSTILSNYSKFDYDVIDCEKKQTVCPGYVDSHTHLVFAGDRSHELRMKLQGKSYLDIAQSGGGIMFSVSKTREASKTELETLALQRLDEMLLHGTTTIEAKSGYGLDAESEIKILEVIQSVNEQHPIDIIPTFLGCHITPKDFLGNQWEYVESMMQLLPQIKSRNLAEFVDIWTDKGGFSVEESTFFLEQSSKLGFKSRVHADELENVGAAIMAANLGAVSADHLLLSEAVSADAMAEANVVANLLPATPFVLMSKKYANFRMFKDAEVTVALSSDFNPNCYVLDMQTVIVLGCFMMKMLPEEAMTASTYGGAMSLNRENEIGSIDLGKSADIQILDIPNVDSIPYRFGVNHVNTVIKKGKVLVKDGKKMV
ncbi:MAG: imidazolonepropionase [Candidatus Heimdallarchaeaceae archaeon]